jgi:hypothetical protein
MTVEKQQGAIVLRLQPPRARVKWSDASFNGAKTLPSQ